MTNYLVSASLVRSKFTTSWLLVLGFVLALLFRIKSGYPDVSQSASAGLLFAACLMVLSLCYGVKVKSSLKNVSIGLAGGLFLCLPVVLQSINGISARSGNFIPWSLVIIVVAFAEEMFFRGVLFDAISKSLNSYAAVLITSVLFALLHLPLYGWRSLPLDFAVGIWLGCLRLVSGSFISPAISHIIADLLAWWI